MQAASPQRQRLRRDGDVGAAAGRDPRHLLLVVDLLGPDPVGPDAGRVDDVVGLDLEALAGLGVDAGDAGGAPVAVEQLGDLGAVQRTPRRSARPRRGSSAPGGRRRSGSRRRGRRSRGSRRRQRRDQLERPPRRRSCGGGRAPSSRRPRARSARSRRAWPTRVVAITSYMLSPIPIAPAALVLAERRDQERRRVDEVRRELDHQLALEQRLADQAEVEVLQVAQPAVDHLRGAARGADRVVVALDQRDRVAARGGVEGDARRR